MRVSRAGSGRQRLRLGFPEFISELLISLNQSIRQGHAEEVTNTVEMVLGRQPIGFEQFVEDHKGARL